MTTRVRLSVPGGTVRGAEGGMRMLRRLRHRLPCALVLGMVGMQAAPSAWMEQPPAQRKPQVEMVQTVGCVEQRGSTGWWLTRAADPTVTRPGVFNRNQVDEVRGSPTLGANEFRLVGVADFLDADGLLATRGRSEFTTPDQVNATGELLPGRMVLVKGLLIEGDELSSINLTVVVGLSDACAAQG